MKFMQRAALGATYSVLSMALFGFGFLLSLLVVLGNADTIKGALSESGIYTSFVQDALQREGNKNETSSLPVNDPHIQAAIEKAFPAESLEQDGNKIIDGMYGWLQGKTDTPQFSIDLTASKERLANSVADYVRQRVSSLPACTGPAVHIEVDVYNATCRPPAFSADAAAAQVRRDILNAGGPLQEPVLTSQSLKDDQGRSLTEQFQNLPQAYQDMQRVIIATGILALLAAVMGIALHPVKRAGLRRVSVVLLSVGIMSLLVAWIGTTILQGAVESIAGSAQQNSLLQDKIGEVSRILTGDVRNAWMIYGGVLTGFGVLVLLAMKFLLPKPPAAPRSSPPVKT